MILLAANVISIAIAPIVNTTTSCIQFVDSLIRKEQTPQVERIFIQERIAGLKNPNTQKAVEIRGVLAHLAHRLNQLNRALERGAVFELHVEFGDWSAHEDFKFRLELIEELVQRLVRFTYREHPDYAVDEFDDAARYYIDPLVDLRQVRDNPDARTVVVSFVRHELKPAA